METIESNTNEGLKVKEDIQTFGETTTITQTIEIPIDHRVLFEFIAPKEIPAGKAQVELKVTPVVEQENRSVLKPDKSRETPLTDSLAGILSHLGDISLEEIREERLKKYLK